MKQDNECAQVSIRFFLVLEQLTQQGRITGIPEFCKRYGINSRSCYFQRKDPTRRILTSAWLVYLVRDYGISANYLLTGNGSMLQNTPQNNILRAKKVQEIKVLLDELC